MKNKLFLVDGNALIYQSYYAFKKAGLQDRNGNPIGAFYGFARKIISLIKNQEFSNIIVSFDSKGKKTRHELFEEYKANRKPMPDELVEQLNPIKKFLDVLKIKRIEIEGYEADDIIGSLSEEYKGDYEIVIYTPDKDLLQLIDEKVKILKIGRKNDKLYDIDKFKKKYNFEVGKFVDYLSLIGDKSDNIPGVSGIGPKTAKKLLSNFESVEDIIENKDKIKNKRAQRSLKDNIEDLKLSKELVLIEKDLDIDINIDKTEFPKYNTLEVRKFLKENQFHSLLKEFPKKEEDFEEMEYLKESKLLKKDKDKILIHDFQNDNNAEVYSMVDDKFYGDVDLEKIFEKKGFKIFIYDAHKYFKEIKNISAKLFDIRIYEYWYNHSSASKNREKFYKKYDIKNVNELYNLFKKFKLFIKKLDKYDYFINKEQKFVEVILEMEKKGLKIDRNLIERYDRELSEDLEKIESKIYDFAGEKFNVRSPKQLGEILFDKMGLTPPDGKIKKTKTGYSTDQGVLENLRQVHPIADEILKYREKHKIYSTYVKPYLEYMDKDNRIYSYFDYCGTATGRLSSSNPNLQNIPIKGEWGERMRKLFIPRSNYKILSADYSQMELRLLAYFSKDENLLNIFKNDGDIHKETAEHIFGISNKKTRNLAKSINYGIVYGQSPYGLSKQLNIPIDEARDYIDRYFERFSGVENYINEQIKNARKNGWVTVISGRRRYVNGINSNNRFKREAAERIAINTPLQGSSADILKTVMIDIYEKIKNNNDIYMISQIHDELLFEVRDNMIEKYKSEIKKIMENIPFDIDINMKVDISKGDNWGEAH